MAKNPESTGENNKPDVDYDEEFRDADGYGVIKQDKNGNTVSQLVTRDPETGKDKVEDVPLQQ